jgi:uncharacterized membrane protein (UPF0182 family)
MHDRVIYPTDSEPRSGRSGAWIVLALVVLILLFSFRTLVSYYVENLWFGSLGFSSVF